MNRRIFLEKTTKAGIGTLALSAGLPVLESCSSSKIVSNKPRDYNNSPGFQQRALLYNYGALEPYIDAATMEIHFTKHAAAYTKNMNEAIVAENVVQPSLESLLNKVSTYSTKLRNNAGGHYNHESFWTWMAPAPTPPAAGFVKAVEAAFGSIGNMKNIFTDAAMKRFGSGWSWLVLDPAKKMIIGSTPNQDNPLMDVSELKGFPLLGLDVWEHAYYLKYQNKRADYISAWWNLVNWPEVENRYYFALNT